MIDDDALRDLIYAHDGDVADLPFWRACREGRFLVMRCGLCDRHLWPAGDCPEHGAQAMAWVEAAGTGTVHVHTVMRRGTCPATGEPAPYAVAVVALDEGPFFHTSIVGIEAPDVRHGLRVRAEFVTGARGLVLPVFRPV